MSASHAHKFEKLNESAIFCAGCGEINVVPEPTHYAPCPYPHWYVYPSIPSTPVYPWIVTNPNTVTYSVTDTTTAPTYPVIS